ncbi:hypothetical protein [Candidatus Accumulibacter sp. ACC003]|nr:hypothetical protein [Candidatus Accumulibacter sp. ACC003]
MLDLFEDAATFLKPEHFRCNPSDDSRNRIGAAPAERRSLRSPRGRRR